MSILVGTESTHDVVSRASVTTDLLAPTTANRPTKPNHAVDAVRLVFSGDSTKRPDSPGGWLRTTQGRTCSHDTGQGGDATRRNGAVANFWDRERRIPASKEARGASACARLVVRIHLDGGNNFEEHCTSGSTAVHPVPPRDPEPEVFLSPRVGGTRPPGPVSLPGVDENECLESG